jgi:hypothetical protein
MACSQQLPPKIVLTRSLQQLGVRLIMVPPFDIFRVLNDQEPLWIEAAMTLDVKASATSRRSTVISFTPQKTDVEIAMTVRRSANIGPKFSTHSEPLTVHLDPRLIGNPEK